MLKDLFVKDPLPVAVVRDVQTTMGQLTAVVGQEKSDLTDP